MLFDAVNPSAPTARVTDPYEVGSRHRGAAAAAGLTVDVHAAALLSVPQEELHAPVEVLQAGYPRQVHGAQPQLLHPRGPPLLQAEDLALNGLNVWTHRDYAHILTHSPQQSCRSIWFRILRSW